MITRLPILAALAVVFVVALAAEAQQVGKVHRVGFLWESPATLSSGIESFRRELRNLGWVEGQNVVVEYRWSEGQYDRLNDMARELVRLKVDLIVAPSSVYTEAAKRATSTIPIVFAVHADPVLRQRPGAAQGGRSRSENARAGSWRQASGQGSTRRPAVS